MKDKIIAIFLLLFCNVCFGQNLKLSGKVESRPYIEIVRGKEIKRQLAKTGKVYYTALGKKFNPANFFVYNEKQDYIFQIPIKKIKAEKIQTLVFALNPTIKSDGFCIETYKIHVGEIIKAPQFTNSKNIELRTDLFIENDCIETKIDVSTGDEGVETKNKKRLLGRYQMVWNDSTYTIVLNDAYQYTYNSISLKQNNDLMDEEYGSWDFDNDNQILTFNIDKQGSTRYGLMLNKKYKISFSVKEDVEMLKFTAIDSNASLIKM